MKKILLVIVIFSLTGCSLLPVKRTFPTVPDELMTQCPELQTIKPGTKEVSQVLEAVTKNYSQYNQCKYKVEAWVSWYRLQKGIFDSVK